MTDQSDDWAALQAAWQTAPQESDAIVRYRARAMRERRRAMAETIGEVFLSLACAAVFGFWARDLAGLERLVLIGLALMALASIPAGLLLRRSLWRAYGDTLAGHAAFLRRRARLGLWFARFGYLGGPLGLTLGAALAGLGDFGPLRPAGDGLVIGGAMAAMAALCLWSLGEARRFRRALDEIPIDDPPSGSV